MLSRDVQAIDEDEYSTLINRAKKSLEGDILIERSWDEFIVVGDTHGDINAAKVPVEKALREDIPIVFLGDYVDRGEKQLENLAYLLEVKKDRPERTILLRGNHESEDMNRTYGFYSVVQRRFSSALYELIVSLYERLPAAAKIGSFFLSHGGIPEGVSDIKKMKELKRDDERYEEIFWNDPSEDIMWFEKNHLRGGIGKRYGRKAVDHFLEKNSLSLLIRGHQCFPKGFKYFFDRKLLSIFSIPNYCGNRVGKYTFIRDGTVNIENIT